MQGENKMQTIFSQIKDPRSHINKRHNLIDILMIGMISVICGAETWQHMVTFANSKVDFLKTFLELPNGIPSDDTINQLFSSIDSNEFERCFGEWIKSISTLVTGQVLAIDGKALRGAKNKGIKSPIHMVSAWACDNNIVLGQVRVNDKSNEITAIPVLLDLLNIEGNIITIDAMGCQTKIAETIIEKKGNYILAVKSNQSKLLDQVKDEFLFSKEISTNTTVDGDHGRIETRECSVINSFTEMTDVGNWKKLTTIIRIKSKREFKNSEKKEENSIRYYIASF